MRPGSGATGSPPSRAATSSACARASGGGRPTDPAPALPDRRVRADLPRAPRIRRSPAPQLPRREHLHPRRGVGFLTKLAETYAPDAIVWVNDAGNSGRKELFPAYKANREAMEEAEQEEFDQGVERVSQLLAGFRIPLVAVDGFEADDVIGTLADRAVAAGWDAVIVSGDKDLYQLIRPGVAILNPGRSGPGAVDPIWVDGTNAEERLGVPPTQVVDYLAMVGDSADNIPGVKGIGEKGAAELLRTYGDLENILAHADEVKNKRQREGLQNYAAEARLSKVLATLKLDVPVTLDLEGWRPRPADNDALATLYA